MSRLCGEAIGPSQPLPLRPRPSPNRISGSASGQNRIEIGSKSGPEHVRGRGLEGRSGSEGVGPAGMALALFEGLEPNTWLMMCLYIHMPQCQCFSYVCSLFFWVCGNQFVQPMHRLSVTILIACAIPTRNSTLLLLAWSFRLLSSNPLHAKHSELGSQFSRIATGGLLLSDLKDQGSVADNLR